jgi:excisionase family DNA binding protein
MEEAMVEIQVRPVGMSVMEAAVEAGVSESTLYALANQGKLPGARRVGKRIIIHRAVFEEWLRTGQGS